MLKKTIVFTLAMVMMTSSRPDTSPLAKAKESKSSATSTTTAKSSSASSQYRKTRAPTSFPT